MMRTLYNWAARRAGGRITIYGRNHIGDAERLVGVDKIDIEHECPVATTKDGEKVLLSLVPQT